MLHVHSKFFLLPLIQALTDVRNESTENNFKILILVVCLSAISYAIWVVHCRRIFAALFQPTLYVACAFIMIIVGLTSILASIGAFYAASKELRCLMHSYAVTNIVLFIMMIIVGIMGYVFQWQLAEHAVDTQLWSNLQHFYGQPGHEDMTKAWDYMQQEFHCCGVDDDQKNFVIWRTSKWHMDYRGTPKKLVPSSCCRRLRNGSFVDESVCQLTDMKAPNASIIFVKGCYLPLFNNLIKISTTESSLAIVASVSLLIAAFFCSLLAKLIQK